MSSFPTRNTAPSFDNDDPHQAAPTLTWQTMFQQLKDFHDLGHTKGYPPRMARWMAAQRRQYRPYGIGKKAPVGIIKQRIKKLNSLGFDWELPNNANVGVVKKVNEIISKRSIIKHNLILSGGTTTAPAPRTISRGKRHLSPTGDFVKSQTHSLRGRIRVPSRKAQESYETDLQIESMEARDMGTRKKYDDDVSTVTSGDGSSLEKKNENQRLPYFPGILLDFVNDMNETNPDIVEWLPDGDGFRINDEVSTFFFHPLLVATTPLMAKLEDSISLSISLFMLGCHHQGNEELFQA